MKLTEITIEQIEVGQDLLISCQSCFKWIRVLKKPTLGEGDRYKHLKCSTRKELGKFILTPEDHNFTQYINLYYRQIILIEE